MNNNKLQRLDKLTAEYHDLNGKISRLDAFINHINFETTVPDAEERMLLCHQLTAMSSYRTNLKARIYLLKAQLEQDMDKNGPQVQQHHCGQDTRRRDEAAAKLCDLLVKGLVVVYAPREKCAKCGGDLLEGLGTAEGEKILCFNCANQITNDELQQALDEYRAACTHHCGQDVRVQYDPNESQPVNVPVQGDDCDDACCQARAGRVDHDAAPAASHTGESLQQLVGYQVIAVCKPVSKCNGCPYEHYNAPCVKVEIVGGFFLCMEPLPNSIVTE